MADRGFSLRDALALINLTLNIPPFAKQGFPSSISVTKNRKNMSFIFMWNDVLDVKRLFQQ